MTCVRSFSINPNGGSIVKDDRRGKRIIDIGAWKRYIKLLIEYLLRRYAPTSVTLSHYT